MKKVLIFILIFATLAINANVYVENLEDSLHCARTKNDQESLIKSALGQIKDEINRLANTYRAKSILTRIGIKRKIKDKVRAYISTHSKGMRILGKLEPIDSFDVDLSGLDLREIVFENVNFSRTHLDGTNLSKASFLNCFFLGLNISAANFSEANFWGTDTYFMDVSIVQSSFKKARFRNVVFTVLSLSGSDFSEAVFTRSFYRQLEQMSVNRLRTLKAKNYEKVSVE
jgi:uncharacterized protein YjbI with pentapeptide repeats